MPDDAVKLTLAEQLYPDPETVKTPEPAKEEKPDLKETPTGPDGQVKDTPEPPSTEGAKDKIDPADLDWMDKESLPGQPDDEEAKKTSADPSVKVTYAGREVTLGELQEETSKLEAGYTKKQMALADKQKAADENFSASETQKAELVTSLTEVQTYLQSVVQQEPDWGTLKAELDTDEFLLKKMEFDETKSSLKQVSDSRQALVQEQLDKKARKEMGILAEKYYPDWSDPKKCEAHISSVISYNEKSYGYQKAELKHIMYDNRLFRMAADAASWRKHKEALKKIASHKTADDLPTTVRANGGEVKDPAKKVVRKDMAETLYPQYTK